MTNEHQTKRWIRTSFLIVSIVCLAGAVYATEPLEPSGFPSLVSSLRIKSPLDFCGETVPLNNQEVRERMEKELMLSLWDRPQVILWLKRSTRFIPLIERSLTKQGVPTDLKYVTLIESALRPHVGSPKGALGFWQFMKATGQNYGLIINDAVDERRNVFASTRGAVKYFKALHMRFGSWTLAAAAFNMGEEGLESEIIAQKTKNYYDLYLPLETQRYMFRVLSAKLILSDPKRYGFNLTPVDFYPPLQYDRTRLNLPEETPIQLVAQAAETSFKKIKDLNPEIRGYYLPKGDHTLLIPKGATKEFHKRLKELAQNWRNDRQHRIYVVKKGESLSTIADKFNVPLPALLLWNRLDMSRPIHPGDRLIVAPAN